MKKISKMLALAACAAALSLSAGNVLAQGRGNFDPAQFRQSRIDRYKEQMDVKDDAEWKVIETAIGKVMDAGQEVLSSRFGGGMRSGRGGGGSSGGSSTSTSTSRSSSDQNSQSNRRTRGGFGTPSPEAEALSTAIEGKASSDVIKAKLAALRAANKAREEKLEATQDDLRKLLTPRQEAVAVLGGLLK